VNAPVSGPADAQHRAFGLGLVLGIETSCDETAAAVVRGGTEVLSSVVATQHELHERYAGVVPEIASRAHLERILPTIRRAMRDAGIELDALDAVAVGHRPGLIGSLLVGISAAKGLAWTLGVPLIGVDHVGAHLHAGLLEAPPVEWPALGLVVSGGHTSLFRIESRIDGQVDCKSSTVGRTACGAMTVIGRTIDDAVGEAYDKVAMMLDLPYPGGPHLDRLATTGRDDAFEFPRSMPRRDSLDFSFSGLKTAVLYTVRGKPAPPNPRRPPEPVPPLDDARRADIAASFQRAAVDVIVRKVTLALERFPAPTLLVGGGVSANSRLRSALTELAKERGLDLRLPKMAWCVDNAAMIAGAAHDRLLRGESDALDLRAATSSAIAMHEEPSR